MNPHRRNTISHDAEIVVLVVAAIAGIAAALAGCEPTGHAVPDAVLCASTAAFVTWLGASAPWWALLASAGTAAIGASFGALWLVALAWAAMAGATWIGATKANHPALRAGIAAGVVQVAFRLELHRFFLLSALVAAAAIGLIAVTGLMRRYRYVRKRILFVAGGLALFAALAGIGMAAGAVKARPAAADGYQLLLDGLEQLDGGDTVSSAATLRSAADSLRDAYADLDAFYTWPAMLVPVIAQNQDIAAEVVGRAAEAAEAAAATLDLVDLEQLRIVNGRVDINSMALLQAPLAELEATIAELTGVLHEAESPWLIAPLQTRIARAQARADKVNHQAAALSAVARVGPAMLGGDEPRRYLIAFTNSAEARATAGLMGNWSELTIIDGKLEITASGRTKDLEQGTDEAIPAPIDMSDEYFGRYGQFGAGERDTTVRRKYWGNATMTPDMPLVGTALRQMYEAATGRTVNGVILFDPAGIAALLEIAGSVTLPEHDLTLSAENAEQFLLIEQYQKEEAVREEILDAVIEATIDAVLTSELPSPPAMIGALATPALEGHITVWAVEPDEEEMLALAGIEGALPVMDATLPGSDGLAVVTNNASANKIDSLLQREVTYRATHDPDTGRVQATVEVTLTNLATTDLPDYVIANKVDLPSAWNRTILSIYSPLTLQSATSDPESTPIFDDRELGWNVYSTFVDIAPGGSVTFVFTLAGAVEPGTYSLVYRPQGLPLPDHLAVEVNSRGDGKVDFTGELGRRSVIDAEGVRAWR